MKLPRSVSFCPLCDWSYEHPQVDPNWHPHIARTPSLLGALLLGNAQIVEDAIEDHVYRDHGFGSIEESKAAIDVAYERFATATRAAGDQPPALDEWQSSQAWERAWQQAELR